MNLLSKVQAYLKKFTIEKPIMAKVKDEQIKPAPIQKRKRIKFIHNLNKKHFGTFTALKPFRVNHKFVK